MPELPAAVALEGVTARYAPGEPPALTALRPPARAGAADRARRAERRRQDDGHEPAAPLPRSRARPGDGRRPTTCASCASTTCGARSRSPARTRTSSTRRSARTSPSRARSATDAELEDALDRARLGEWVASLPDGLDTLVGEEGTQLSGGQRQRLTVARALLSDAPVLVLDEPTAHLDPETAEVLVRDILAAADDRTVLLITHRPEGLDLVDEVVELSPRQVSGRDQSAATSPPPSWARRLPKRRKAGCGEMRPAASDSPCRNVVARSSRLSGTKEKTSPT